MFRDEPTTYLHRGLSLSLHLLLHVQFSVSYEIPGVIRKLGYSLMTMKLFLLKGLLMDRDVLLALLFNP